MTARQFPKTLMRGAMWSEQLCLYEFFKTWTPVGFSNHEFLTLRRFIWRLVKLETKIKCAKCSPDNCLQPCFWLNHFDLFFDEIWSFEWSPLMSQNRRWRKDSRTPCIYAITPVCICISRPARGEIFPHISRLRSKREICNISPRP